MSTRVVAFDVYDTLVHWPDSRVQPIDLQRLLGRYGVEISYQAYEAARQSTFFFDCVKRPIEGWTDFLALVFARMGVSISIDLLVALTSMYETRNNMEFFPDAIGAIDAVRARGLVACAFTTLPKFMIGSQRHELLSRLNHYFDASAIGLPKGHPGFYRRITERLGVTPQEILCIGDDPICDVELSAECGWRAVLLDRKNNPRSSSGGQIATIRTLDELTALLD